MARHGAAAICLALGLPTNGERGLAALGQCPERLRLGRVAQKGNQLLY